jgi:hypothetical protein
LVLQKYFQDFYFEHMKLQDKLKNAVADKEILEEKLKEIAAE